MLWVELKVLARLIIEAPAGVPRATAGRRAPAVPRPAVPRSRRPVPPREPKREPAPRRTAVTAEQTSEKQ
jgi:hypothetical protein